MSGHSISKADMISSNQEQFTYDYDTLRTTGLILAVIMFVTGIVIALMRVRQKHQRPRFQVPPKTFMFDPGPGGMNTKTTSGAKEDMKSQRVGCGKGAVMEWGW
ncbi:uncharacterized protein LOC125448427 isoform X1 [Stegostoma tigrinum]|uniref:uncharacterized protein LOC125448427 isoform X1 n=1 Tax=Stegostoma tigrinum TaxID=3053191 RepID=UPI0028706057|nr:uncharacterized protein LOC125448427 isoform X1 [Stegostoma tigrinum]